MFPKTFHSRNQHKTQVRKFLNIPVLYAIHMGEKKEKNKANFKKPSLHAIKKSNLQP